MRSLSRSTQPAHSETADGLPPSPVQEQLVLLQKLLQHLQGRQNKLQLQMNLIQQLQAQLSRRSGQSQGDSRGNLACSSATADLHPRESRTSTAFSTAPSWVNDFVSFQPLAGRESSIVPKLSNSYARDVANVEESHKVEVQHEARFSRASHDTCAAARRPPLHLDAALDCLARHIDTPLRPLLRQQFIADVVAVTASSGSAHVPILQSAVSGHPSISVQDVPAAEIPSSVPKPPSFSTFLNPCSSFLNPLEPVSSESAAPHLEQSATLTSSPLSCSVPFPGDVRFFKEPPLVASTSIHRHPSRLYSRAQMCSAETDVRESLTSQPPALGRGPGRPEKACPWPAGDSQHPTSLFAVQSQTGVASAPQRSACNRSVDLGNRFSKLSNDESVPSAQETGPMPFLLNSEETTFRFCSSSASRAAISSASAVAATADRTGSGSGEPKPEKTTSYISLPISPESTFFFGSTGVASKFENALEDTASCSTAHPFLSLQSCSLSSSEPSLQSSTGPASCLSASVPSSTSGSCPLSMMQSPSSNPQDAETSSGTVDASDGKGSSDSCLPPRCLGVAEQLMPHRRQPSRRCKHEAAVDTTLWWQKRKKVAFRPAAHQGSTSNESAGRASGEEGKSRSVAGKAIGKSETSVARRDKPSGASLTSEGDSDDFSGIDSRQQVATHSKEAASAHASHSSNASASSRVAAVSASSEAGTVASTEALSMQRKGGNEGCEGLPRTLCHIPANESKTDTLGRSASNLGNKGSDGRRGSVAEAPEALGVEHVLSLAQAGGETGAMLLGLPLSRGPDFQVDEEVLLAREGFADSVRSAECRSEASERECAVMLEQLFQGASASAGAQTAGSDAEGVSANSAKRRRPWRGEKTQKGGKHNAEETVEASGRRSCKRARSSFVNKTRSVPATESQAGAASPSARGEPGKEQRLITEETEDISLPNHLEEADEDADEFLTFIGSPSSRRAGRGRSPRWIVSHPSPRCPAAHVVPHWIPNECKPIARICRGGPSPLSDSPCSLSSLRPPRLHHAGFSRPRRRGRGSCTRFQSLHNCRSPPVPSTCDSGGPSFFFDSKPSFASSFCPLSASCASSFSYVSSPALSPASLSTSSPCSPSSSPSFLSFGPALYSASCSSELIARSAERQSARLAAADGSDVSATFQGRREAVAENTCSQQGHPFSLSRARGRSRSAESSSSRQRRNHLPQGGGQGIHCSRRRSQEAQAGEVMGPSCSPFSVQGSSFNSASLAFNAAVASSPATHTPIRSGDEAPSSLNGDNAFCGEVCPASEASGPRGSGRFEAACDATAPANDAQRKGGLRPACARGVGEVSPRTEEKEETTRRLQDLHVYPSLSSTLNPCSSAPSVSSRSPSFSATTSPPLNPHFKLSPSQIDSDRLSCRRPLCSQPARKDALVSGESTCEALAESEGGAPRPASGQDSGDSRRGPAAACCIEEAVPVRMPVSRESTSGIDLVGSLMGATKEASLTFDVGAQERQQTADTETELAWSVPGVGAGEKLGTENEGHNKEGIRDELQSTRAVSKTEAVPLRSSSRCRSISSLACVGKAEREGKSRDQEAQREAAQGDRTDDRDAEKGNGKGRSNKGGEACEVEILASALVPSSVCSRLALQQTKTKTEGDKPSLARSEPLTTGSGRAKESSKESQTEKEKAGQRPDKTTRRRKKSLDQGEGITNRTKSGESGKSKSVGSEPDKAWKSEDQTANVTTGSNVTFTEASTGRCETARKCHTQAVMDAFCNPSADCVSFSPSVHVLSSPFSLSSRAQFPSGTAPVACVRFAGSDVKGRRGLSNALAGSQDPPGRPGGPSGPRSENEPATGPQEPAGVRGASEEVSRMRCSWTSKEEGDDVDFAARKMVEEKEDRGDTGDTGGDNRGGRGREEDLKQGAERGREIRSGGTTDDGDTRTGTVKRGHIERGDSCESKNWSEGVKMIAAMKERNELGVAGSGEEESTSDAGEAITRLVESKTQQTEEEGRGEWSLQGVHETTEGETINARGVRDEPGGRESRAGSWIDEKKASNVEKRIEGQGGKEKSEAREGHGGSQVKNSRRKHTPETSQAGTDASSLPTGRQEKTPDCVGGDVELKGHSGERTAQGDAEESQMRQADEAEQRCRRASLVPEDDNQKARKARQREGRGNRKKRKTDCEEVDEIPLHVIHDEDDIAELHVDLIKRERERETESRDRTAKEEANHVSFVKEVMVVEQELSLPPVPASPPVTRCRRRPPLLSGEERRKRSATHLDATFASFCRPTTGKEASNSLCASAKAKAPRMSQLYRGSILSSPLTGPGQAPPSCEKPLGWGAFPRPRIPDGVALKGHAAETVVSEPVTGLAPKGQPGGRGEPAGAELRGEIKGRVGRGDEISEEKVSRSQRGSPAAAALCPLHGARDLGLLDYRSVGSPGTTSRRLSRATVSLATGQGNTRAAGVVGGEGATAETDRDSSARRGGARGSGRCPCCLKIVNLFRQFSFVRRLLGGSHPLGPFTLSPPSRVSTSTRRGSASSAARGAAPGAARPSLVRRGTLLQVQWRFEDGARGSGCRVSKVSLSGKDPMVGTYFLRPELGGAAPATWGRPDPGAPRPCREPGCDGDTAQTRTTQGTERMTQSPEDRTASSPASFFAPFASKKTGETLGEKATDRASGSGGSVDSRGGGGQGGREGATGGEVETPSGAKPVAKLANVVAGWSGTFTCLEGHVFDRSYEELERGKWCPVCSAAALLTSAAKRSAMRHDRQVEEKFRERQQKLIQEARQQFAATAAGISGSAGTAGNAARVVPPCMAKKKHSSGSVPTAPGQGPATGPVGSGDAPPKRNVDRFRAPFAEFDHGMQEQLRRQAQEDVRLYSSCGPGQNGSKKEADGPERPSGPYIPQNNPPVSAAAAATAAAFAARAAGGATAVGGSSAGGVGGREGGNSSAGRQGVAGQNPEVVPGSPKAETTAGQRSLHASKEDQHGARGDTKKAGKPLTEAQALAVRRVLACKQTSAWSILQIARPSRDTSPQSLRSQARAAFRQLALLVHPDKNPHPRAAEAMHLVTGAFQQLIGHR
ncbi:DnaJ domain-containing protein [Toxoplasma gondii FOU]|uniref:DnaJ domain-containing protein n=3 Tax=Toxoplasma gondii TaxID=5811 RepID=A0A086LEE5_TOXGO|nr:DnaJ domain-containing protein [Toxoplasma gondii FOU]PUA91327.1 DnaJ domain-containing protein [Toxoplasma gondii TgCATBr9]RQX74682.1 DnaJ domain-containing protein [Toxoplasma gondii CAST]